MDARKKVDILSCLHAQLTPGADLRYSPFSPSPALSRLFPSGVVYRSSRFSGTPSILYRLACVLTWPIHAVDQRCCAGIALGIRPTRNGRAQSAPSKPKSRVDHPSSKSIPRLSINFLLTSCLGRLIAPSRDRDNHRKSTENGCIGMTRPFATGIIPYIPYKK
jgi:hypothetical protein